LENIDIDKEILVNIDIDIDIDKEVLENIDIDIDKEILENIDIDKISNRLEFGISNRDTPCCCSFFGGILHLRHTDATLFSLSSTNFLSSTLHRVRFKP